MPSQEIDADMREPIERRISFHRHRLPGDCRWPIRRSRVAYAASYCRRFPMKYTD